MNVGYLAKIKAFFLVYIPIVLFCIFVSRNDKYHIFFIIKESILIGFFFYLILYFPLVRRLARWIQKRQDIRAYHRRMKLEFEYWHKRISSANDFDLRTLEILHQLEIEFNAELRKNSDNLNYIIRQVRELEK